MEQERNSSMLKFVHSSQEVKSATQISKGSVSRTDGSKELIDIARLRRTIMWACAGHEQAIEVDLIINETVKNIFDGIAATGISDALVLGAVAFIERDPAYGYVAARLLFKKLYREATTVSVLHTDVDHTYGRSFVAAIELGVSNKLLDPRMAFFDLDRLSYALVPERDHLFEYMGLRTLYERYFLRHQDRRLELPQAFWMRVAMGLALNEQDKNGKAIEFYTVMSLLRYVPSTPTLLHSGLTRPQLSSCYLTTVEDDLKHIFKCIGDNAQMSKWSGGVANDWSNIRACGSSIESIKTESQGVVPFLKIANDTTAAINRSGKRRSASVVYLEAWHLEIEDFIDLRKNTGDERRRTHDINTATWVPDLFMKRMLADGQWTLFSPEEVPDLHHLYGKAFEERYQQYEEKVQRGEIQLFKTIEAKALWRKMLSRLFETGHPWITFKDPSNIRSPQDHVGVVHSSNLCTEITLNTSAQETAVCNLGSVNFTRHIQADGTIDKLLLGQTVTIAMRMLDNVIDINFYPVPEAETANMRHRPVGLGIMGLQDALYKMNIAFDQERALVVSEELMEIVSYHAILASSMLAQERGAYSSFTGSKWDRNLLPQDTLDILEQERGMPIEIHRGGKLNWEPVRASIKAYGMRNSNTMAIAPTATISTIAGCYPCIEPIYKNIYVKANMTGEFTVVNSYLVQDLKKLGLWSMDMLDKLKYHDGNVQMIAAIPQYIKDTYKETFEIDPLWLIKLTAARGKWIDQSQSHNIFLRGTSGKLLHDVYVAAWKSGLKTTYYLRTLGATQIEKSTLDAQKFGFTQKREYGASYDTSSSQVISEQENTELQRACAIENGPDCEVCQ
jgi:ribonucleoside-diphosphate reductase alpha chain